MIGRRGFLGAAGGALLVAASGVQAATPADPKGLGGSALKERMAALEARSGGRLGVAVFDTGSGRRFSRRGGERFPMCSTFKFPLAAAVLKKVGEGAESLDRRIPVTAADLIPYAPFAETRVNGQPPTVAELCQAAVTLSDNVAANLLLPVVGGPAGLTAFLRAIGDRKTRLDRNEPTLNSAIPGDPRDTTTPVSMVHCLDRLMVGDALPPEQRRQLIDWMVATRTGDKRLRAGVPKGWRVGDKTGTGVNGTANDVAILWPEGRAPVLLASYLTQTAKDFKGQDAVHADVARAVVEALAA
ncbi:class A beta-lactamase [Azospirillum picis]|uniref:Beta-lactamase n=1 Tax=Azospirillum picis TaxID=488438 RepID=A0ABU0MNG6_9PROT|nr:class A beta-lactamase [Azospirillum picis]MBP2301809.1 beta-lactamase class A [Azospirillum picis]MDQ0535016.1 beta-lactamase class A [Azospirillum picis]